jgi:beta-lactamase class C
MLFMTSSPLSNSLKVSPDQIKNLHTTIQTFEKKLLNSVEQGETAGMAVGIMSRDQVYYSKGIGVKRLGFSGPITESSLFQLASVSKPISATVLALLQKEGLCSFKDHPGQYEPYLFKREIHKDLTLKNMLNHTSGLSYEGFEEMIESYIPMKDIREKLAKTLPSRKPGSYAEYNNVVYGFIGDIIRTLSKGSLQYSFENYLFRPLKMHRACLGFPALLEAANRAYPHMENAMGSLAPADHYSHSYYIFPASAGVNASLDDLIRFIQLYLGKYPHLISPDELKPLYTSTIQSQEVFDCHEDPRGLVNEVWYGLGWLILNIGKERVVFHTGWLNGFRNFIGFLPDHDIGIVILTNTDKKSVQRLGLEFFYQYLEK